MSPRWVATGPPLVRSNAPSTAGWRPVAESSSGVAIKDTGYFAQVGPSLEPIGETDDGLLSLAYYRDVESACECLVRAHGGVGTAGHQQREASANALDEPIRMPDPAREQREADHLRPEVFSFGDELLGTPVEASGRCVDDAHFAAAHHQRPRPRTGSRATVHRAVRVKAG